MAPPEEQYTAPNILNEFVSSSILSKEEEAAAIRNFCEFLKFETVSSYAPKTGAYTQCADWLVHQLKSMGVFDTITSLPEAPDHSPVIVAVWRGQDSNLPVLLLNSHYDVVPCDKNEWTIDPFAAVRKNGNIYGRGTQDMKCVCIQYLEAIRKIHDVRPEWKPQRDIYLTFVPDEGMYYLFLRWQDFLPSSHTLLTPFTQRSVVLEWPPFWIPKRTSHFPVLP